MMKIVEATVTEELPGLLYRLVLESNMQVLAHGSLSAPAGTAVRNWVRLLPGDRVEVEFAERDGSVVIVPRASERPDRGDKAVAVLRGTGRGRMSTDELLLLTRD